MRKSQRFFSVLLLCAAAAAQAALPPPPSGKAQRIRTAAGKNTVREFAPVIGDNSIVFGNKKIELLPDGQLKISADGVMIAQVLSFYAVDDLKTKRTDWSSYTAAAGTIRREGNKFVWELKKKTRDAVWKAADQVLTVLPDHRLKLDLRIYPPAVPDYKLRGDRGSQWVVLPLACAEGVEHRFNGKSYVLNSKEKVPASGDSSGKKVMSSIYYSGNPAREFRVDALASDCCWTTANAYPAQKIFRHSFFMKNQWNGTLYLDLRKGVQAAASPDIRGGIDFQVVEKIELPDSTRRNLLPNPSFERGMEGYRIKHDNNYMRWGWQPFALQSKEVRSGNYALEMEAVKDRGNDYRRFNFTANITTHSVVLDPGTYTYSIYAKGEKGCKTLLNSWVPNFNSGNVNLACDPKSVGRFELTPEWKR